MGNDSLGALTWNSLPQAGVLGGVSFTTLTFLGGAAIGYILYDEYKSKSRFDTKRLKYAAKVGALIGGGYAATHALTMAGQRGASQGLSMMAFFPSKAELGRYVKDHYASVVIALVAAEAGRTIWALSSTPGQSPFSTYWSGVKSNPHYHCAGTAGHCTGTGGHCNTHLETPTPPTT